MWPTDNPNFPAMSFSIIFNLMFAFLILHLRRKSEQLPLTQSQRWGLTLLGFLFLTNTLKIIFETAADFYKFSGDELTSYRLTRMDWDFNLLVNLFLLTFGLVFPRPVAHWRRLRLVLAGLGVFWAIMIMFNSLVMDFNAYPYYGSLSWIHYIGFYMFSCFIPIYLWLPQYERQNNPQMRMILTILIWGYMLYFAGSSMGLLTAQLSYKTAADDLVVTAVLISIVYIIMFRAMYMRLGHWASAEKLNLGLLFLALAFGIIQFSLSTWYIRTGINPYTDPFSSPLQFMVTEGAWRYIRPSLFMYALLRYQFFGPDVRADKAFVLMLTITGAAGLFFVGLFSVVGDGSNLGVAIGIGIAMAILLVIPLKWAFEQFVGRLLPMSGAGSKVPLAERRATYLMGLQTAVVSGEVSDTYDQVILKRLRKDLRVSDREHDLLMAGFEREKPPQLKQQLEEVYLFHKGGSLLGYVVRQDKDPAGSKSDMIATMFMAVQEFSKDALKRKGGHLGAIEYGDTQLIIELEGDIALGVILRGRDNPQVRQQMRDTLRKVQDEYSDVIGSMVCGKVADITDLKARSTGLGEMLKEFLHG